MAHSLDLHDFCILLPQNKITQKLLAESKHCISESHFLQTNRLKFDFWLSMWVLQALYALGSKEGVFQHAQSYMKSVETGDPNWFPLKTLAIDSSIAMSMCWGQAGKLALWNGDTVCTVFTDGAWCYCFKKYTSRRKTCQNSFFFTTTVRTAGAVLVRPMVVCWHAQTNPLRVFSTTLVQKHQGIYTRG